MSQLPNSSLELAINLFKTIDNRAVNGRRCEGTLNTDQNFEKIKNQLEIHELLVSEDTNTRHVEFRLPNGFFVNFNDLFSAPSRRITVPEKFYIADIDYAHTKPNQQIPNEIKQYLQAAELFNSLRKLAHELPKGNDIELLIIQKEKISVLSEYSIENLKELIDLDSFLLNFINSEIHKDQKATIIRSSIIDFFNKKESINFSEILINFKEIFKLINSSYQLYVSEFSFLKIKTEIEKEKLEFTTKLNKVFSDIQNQLLAIPAALILIGSQMEKANEWSIKNLIVWFGALIFSLLMNLLIKNQKHTLTAIKSEINQQNHLIKTKHQLVADRFIEIYEQLDSRYKHQKKLIDTIDFLVALALFASTFLLLTFSTNAFVSIFCISLGIGVAAMLKAENYFKSKSLPKDSERLH